MNRKWMIRFAIIELMCAALGFILSAVSARFWTTMFLVFAVGCLILGVVLPIAGLFITAAMGSSTKCVALLAYLTTWLFLLPCSVRYKVPFKTKANLIFMFVTLAMLSQMIIECSLRCTLSDQCGSYVYPTLARGIVLWGLLFLFLLALRMILLWGLHVHLESFASTLVSADAPPPCCGGAIVGYHGIIDKEKIGKYYNPTKREEEEVAETKKREAEAKEAARVRREEARVRREEANEAANERKTARGNEILSINEIAHHCNHHRNEVPPPPPPPLERPCTPRMGGDTTEHITMPGVEHWSDEYLQAHGDTNQL